jgi:hypothetical protein
MRSFKTLGVFAPSVVCALSLALTGCNSSDTSNGTSPADTLAGNQFVASDNAAGSISLRVLDADLSVAQTSGFAVTVKDANGAPVSGIDVACDSESGIAIVEPTSGHEHTDSAGAVSGVIGCTMPGSYELACRLPIGADKRKLARVTCRPPIPNGFKGFPGAAGGGLGGGSALGSGDVNDNISATSVKLIDNGNATSDGTTSIDVVSHQCAGKDTPTTGDDTFEKLFDTLLVADLVNDSAQEVTIDSVNFTVPAASGDGTASYESPSIALSSGAGNLAPNGGTATVTAVVFEVGTVSGKSFVGARSAIPANLGVRNITFRFKGTSADGQSVTLTRTIGVAFADYETCAGL